MPSSNFKFKEFTVWQDKTAMKVGTDGVLLGAWATVSPATSILDIGTGTGLLALMAAQRNTNAKITAIEIDKEAADQALENITNSQFASRIQVVNGDFLTWNCNSNFDRILCNPPFYTNQHRAGTDQRTTARHSSLSTILEILNKSAELISENGTISIIVPESLVDSLKNQIKKLFVNRICLVHPSPLKTAHRALLEFSAYKNNPEIKKLTIEENGRHRYSPDYVNLTKDFYLNF